MITDGYLARHHMGRRGMSGPALLDVAQDYALFHLHDQQVFELGVVLKGGTSLRKFRAGNAGRFSTDLDFAAPNTETGELILDTLDGATVEGVTFAVTNRTALRGALEVDTTLGRPGIPARIEVTPRPLWLPCEQLAPISLPVHRGYEFAMPVLPAPVVVDGLGSAPFDPAAVIEDIDTAKLPSEDIGLLTQPVEPARWLAFVRTRFGFITDLDEAERALARCSPGDGWTARQLTAGLPSPA